MSTWLQLLNELRHRPIEEYLTATQNVTYQSIHELTRFPEWLNLYGSVGTGKTFLSWAVARTTGAVYLSIPEQLTILKTNQDSLIIDNAPHNEYDVRRVLASCNLLGANMVILVTRMPVAMPMRCINLPLPNASDFQTVARSFARMGYPCEQSHLSSVSNFWDLLQACT